MRGRTEGGGRGGRRRRGRVGLFLTGFQCVELLERGVTCHHHLSISDTAVRGENKISIRARLPAAERVSQLLVSSSLGILGVDPHETAEGSRSWMDPLGLRAVVEHLHAPHDPMRSRDASPSSVIGPSASVLGTLPTSPPRGNCGRPAGRPGISPGISSAGDAHP